MKSDPSADWTRMWRTARGRPIAEVEKEYREMVIRHGLRYVDTYAIELTARAVSDPRWAKHHPLGALAFAWRHRKGRGFIRALRAICRPRFAG